MLCVSGAAEHRLCAAGARFPARQPGEQPFDGLRGGGPRADRRGAQRRRRGAHRLSRRDHLPERRRMHVAFLGFAPYAFDSNLLDIPAAVSLVRRAHVRMRRSSSCSSTPARRVPGTAITVRASVLPRRGSWRRARVRSRGDPGRRRDRARVGATRDPGRRGLPGAADRVFARELVGYHTLGGGGILSDSAILRVTLDTRGRVLAADWIPVTLLGGLPRPDRSWASVRIVAELSREDFPGDHFRISADGMFRLFLSRPSPAVVEPGRLVHVLERPRLADVVALRVVDSELA